MEHAVYPDATAPSTVTLPTAGFMTTVEELTLPKQLPERKVCVCVHMYVVCVVCVIYRS
jgi:hypothetical protein